ncbi:MAG: hypothetical protein FWF10_03460 [Clostridiales bacterium]|nr:hypothetical protein [Clostridiales bacterium]
MKRIPFILLACVLLLCALPLPLVARANGMVIPENDFYERHKDKCITVEQYFCFTDGRDFSLKKEPGAKDDLETDEFVKKLVSDEGFFVHYAYLHRGIPWGYVAGLRYGYSFSGWISLDGAMLAYNEDFFAEDFKDLFYSYPGGKSVVLAKLESATDLVFWHWPCSGEQAYINDWRNLPVITASDISDAKDFAFSNVYRDAQGREWVYITCYWKSSWICLDDPENDAIPKTINHPRPWGWGPEDFPVGGMSIPLWIAIVVSAIAISAAVLVLIFWKPRRDG